MKRVRGCDEGGGEGDGNRDMWRGRMGMLGGGEGDVRR